MDDKIKILEWPLQKLHEKKLPTNSDVLKAVYFEKAHQSLTIKDAIAVVVGKIDDLWKKTTIPTVSKKITHRKTESYVQKYRDLMKNEYTKDINGFQAKFFKVF